MDAGWPPHWLLRDADLAVRHGSIRPREGSACLVGWRGEVGILRSVPLPADPGARAALSADVTWLHAFLARLAEHGFPAPRPLPAFDGKSWTARAGMLWQLISYLPGHAVGWADQPPMEEVGACLARYHAVARRIDIAGPRPISLPLADVPQVLLSAQMEAAGVSAERLARICRLAGQLASDLASSAPQASGHLIIHGDFTTDNVVASGRPARVTGVIDFALAHQETRLADIAYSLWRSGRPRPDADFLDLTRVRRFVRGYTSAGSLSQDEARVIPVYLRGRGLQMIAKRIRAGRPDTTMLAEVQWLSANYAALSDALVAALP